MERLCSTLEGKRRGLIVCGPQNDGKAAEAAIQLAEKLGFPILADPLSSLRSGIHDKSHIIDGYDSFLRAEKFNSTKPDIIIRIGAMPVSKALTIYMKNLSIDHWVIDSGGMWRDPIGKATEMIFADEASFLSSMADRVTFSVESSWLSWWTEINGRTQKCIAEYEAKGEHLDEGLAVKKFLDKLPDDSLLFVSNSMPIRDLDTFLSNKDKNIKVMATGEPMGLTVWFQLLSERVQPEDPATWSLGISLFIMI